jgi:hypothetical protein
MTSRRLGRLVAAVLLAAGLLAAGLLAAGCTAADELAVADAAARVADAPEAVEAPAELEGHLAESGGVAADATPGDAAAGMEHLLAAIDTGEERPEQETVERYAQALTRAESVCEQDRDPTGDIAARSWEIVSDAGRDVTVMEMLEAMEQGVPAQLAPRDCVEVMAAVITLLVG